MDASFRVARLTAKVQATEAAIDDAMAAIAELLTEVREHQRGTKTSAVVTDPVVAKLAAAMSAVSEARSDVVGAHRRMDKIREDMGLRTSAAIEYKGAMESPETVVAHLDTAAA